MEREPIVGETLVVARADSSMPVRVGDRLVVTHVDDDDNTLRGVWSGATPPDMWISWSEVEPVEFGWEFARRHLPAEVAELLGACTRIGFLNLNPHVKRAIVDSLPDWRERVMTAIAVTHIATDDDQETEDSL
jgi:hypothetical protein